MPEPIIDLHTLFGPVPPRGVAEAGTGPLRALLAKHGVAGAIAISTRGLYHSAPAGNRETIALCREAGATLQPGAVLDPRIPDPLATLSGARMLFAMPATQGWPMLYAPFVDALRTVGPTAPTVPLWIEVRRAGDATGALTVLRDASFTGPVVFGGVGADTLIEAITVARTSDRFLLATTGLRGIGDVNLAVSSLGAARVLLGSGAPGRSLGAGLALVRQARLSTDDTEAVLGGNAKRLLAGGGIMP